MRDKKSGAISLADIIGKLVAAQQAQLVQVDEIAALKAELAKLKEGNSDEDRYELNQIGVGLSALHVEASDARHHRIGSAVTTNTDPQWL